MKQQIVISGVGGQGIIFATRLLAEAAILKGFSVISSETHGMAQRGGTVLSHLKVGNFSSPLIRPGNADVLLALKAAGLTIHGYYLKPGGWAAVNSSEESFPGQENPAFPVDADSLAQDINSPKSANLILLGFAFAAGSKQSGDMFFCSVDDIKMALERRLAARKKIFDDAVKAFETGFNRFQG